MSGSVLRYEPREKPVHAFTVARATFVGVIWRQLFSPIDAAAGVFGATAAGRIMQKDHALASDLASLVDGRPTVVCLRPRNALAAKPTLGISNPLWPPVGGRG
jgi:hypothetical protein